jgi:hypothetical protein
VTCLTAQSEPTFRKLPCLQPSITTAEDGGLAGIADPAESNVADVLPVIGAWGQQNLELKPGAKVEPSSRCSAPYLEVAPSTQHRF